MRKTGVVLVLLMLVLLTLSACNSSPTPQPTPVAVSLGAQVESQAISYNAPGQINTAKAIAAGETLKDIVYIVPDGHTFHRQGCRYLFKAQIPIERQEAQTEGYTPCF